MCGQQRLLSFFLKDPSDLNSRSLKTCANCRASTARSIKKRKALGPIDPNIPSKRPTIARAKPVKAPSIPPPQIQSVIRPEPAIYSLPSPESRPQAPLLTLLPVPELPSRPPPPSPPPIQPAGFLPVEQWRLIQDFHTALDGVKMEYCLRCRERWFSMGLKNEICDACFLRDKGSQSLFLMSTDNEMDPGEVPAYLPALTQVEEMTIARSHVQMLVHRYRGHQYHYSGHCVSFMQSNVKTINMLPNLPSELDIVILRPSNQVMEDDQRYQSQFRADFRVRKGHILTWLRYLKANYPDYRYITISPERLNTLPIDGDISLSFPSIIDESIVVLDAPVTDPPVTADLPPPTSQSMVPNLNVSTTEADILMASISGRAPLPPGLPAPSIRSTPLDEAAGRERLFAMAFPTLYPTGRADFNTARERKVDLNDYARHMMCYHDGRFGSHPRWRFLIFNLLMRRKASNSARFYVSKASGLKDLNREELTEALQTDESLLSHIVRQGFMLTGTRPFWRNKGTSLQAQARFLTPGMSPVFVIFSAADM